MATLLKASRAVTSTEKGTPAVAEAGAATSRVAAAAGFTVNDVLVPLCAPPDVRVAVIVREPELVTVMLCEASTPFVNVPVVPPPELSVPVDEMSTVLPAPLYELTVLPYASRAVARIVKAGARGLGCRSLRRPTPRRGNPRAPRA